MLASGMVGMDGNAVMQQSTLQASTSSHISLVKVAEASAEATETKPKKLDPNEDIESRVRLYFRDTPIMAEIVKCESQFRQFSANGNVIRGKVNSQDVGIAQVNEYYHLKRSKKFGYDIYTVEGNMAYAKLLYEEEGTDPWISSAPCWKKSDVAKAMSSNSKRLLADNIK